ncbi:MAG: glycosyl hydrolase family 2, partial [Bacteroidales bacterium]|nr:glycosyl hydrolase family 2 [Bacteroidales bacterium]
GLAQTWPVMPHEAKPGVRWYVPGSAFTREDVVWNLDEYARAGLGYLELTPIYGVEGNESQDIPFLSEEWMEMYKFIVEEAAKRGIVIDMAMGSGWVFGGPTTPLSEAACKLSYSDLRAGRKECRDLDVSLPDKKEMSYASLCRVMAYGSDGSIIDVTPFVKGSVLNWRMAKTGVEYRVIALYHSRTLQRVKRAAPGGEGWAIDPFDRTAVRHYLSHIDSAFVASGAPYPRCFFADSYEVFDADWTPSVLDEFEKRRGYRLQDRLPEFLVRKPEIMRDFRQTLGELLYENYTVQWNEWAHERGILTRNQAHGSPGNLIDIYAASDIPEIEGFGITDFGIKGLRTDPGHVRSNDSDVSMLKYAASAAHVAGKRLVSCESLTWLTEHFRTSLSQMKPELDLAFTCGVNHVFLMSTPYSPRDVPWPGWKFYATVDISPTNSLWRDIPYLTQYIERTQTFLQMGDPDADFLIYLPMKDLYSIHYKETDPLAVMYSIHLMKILAPDFIKSVLAIDEAGFDGDYISDALLLGTSFRDGRLFTPGGTSYKALILPNKLPLPEAVQSHIDALRTQGAVILRDTDTSGMAAAARPEEMKARCGLRYIRRRDADGWHYFICNLTPDDFRGAVSLSVPFCDAALFDPMTGRVSKTSVADDKVRLSLRSGESIILKASCKPLSSGLMEDLPAEAGERKALDGPWVLSFVESAPEVKGTFLLDSLRTWESLEDPAVAVTMGTGAYVTHLSLSPEEAAARWELELGDVRESARVYINGEYVGCAWAVPFRLDCGTSLKAGDNEIRIEVTNLPANRISD